MIFRFFTVVRFLFLTPNSLVRQVIVIVSLAKMKPAVQHSAQF